MKISMASGFFAWLILLSVCDPVYSFSRGFQGYGNVVIKNGRACFYVPDPEKVFPGKSTALINVFSDAIGGSTADAWEFGWANIITPASPETCILYGVTSSGERATAPGLEYGKAYKWVMTTEENGVFIANFCLAKNSSGQIYPVEVDDNHNCTEIKMKEKGKGFFQRFLSRWFGYF